MSCYVVLTWKFYGFNLKWNHGWILGTVAVGELYSEEDPYDVPHSKTVSGWLKQTQ